MRDTVRGTLVAMDEYTHSLVVDVPVRVAYDQWTQMEEFPRFMEGVDDVRQVTDTHMHWRVSIGGVEREFDAVITDQVPDQVIAWASVDGPKQAGTVTFRALDPERTEVALAMVFEPEGLVESAGEALGIVESHVRGDLERFKEFIESRGAQTGSWRGEVLGGVRESPRTTSRRALSHDLP
jgi:uncharacterized membrane protein